MSSKSVKLFNLEERKNATGSITDVDIYQWKNTLLDHLRREPEFKEHVLESSRWQTEKVKNRGFEDVEENDGNARKKADQVASMLTKIASYAPKALVREITKRTTCLEDVWAITREWAGIHSYGTKHLEYYKVKNSYLKDDTEESPQEFFYRLRAAMEDTLVQRSDNLRDNGKMITEDEDMTPTVRSLIVLDWMHAIGGPALVEHVHRAYATELETTTLASLQPRIWKNLSALMREIEETEDRIKVSRCSVPKEQCRYVKSISNAKKTKQQRFPIKRNQEKYAQKYNNTSELFCKLCKASGSKNFRSHNIAECWLLSDVDRKAISNASAKANALFAYEEELDENSDVDHTEKEQSSEED